MTPFHQLAQHLWRIEKLDQVGDYPARNRQIVSAVAVAMAIGWTAGFDLDPDPVEPTYPMVAYIDLPTGQVSWHLPAYGEEWDGHTTEEKYARCRAFAGPLL